MSPSASPGREMAEQIKGDELAATDGRGVGQKFEKGSAPTPHPVSRADFFRAGENFELFATDDAPTERPQAASKRRAIDKSTERRAEIGRLAAAGFTRLEIAKRLGMAESSLYANFFPEIGGRHGCPGRRLHEPSEDTRRLVRELRRAGEPLIRIAAAIGISQPTLRRAYAADLTTLPSDGADDAE